ncbi:MAG: protein translocase subunit SecF [Actinomycetota bacterium]|nr:protein translocase subunit SecF [Actinomycetota bacterium]
MTEPVTPVPTDGPPKASLRHRLYHGETTINFVGRKNVWFAVSGLVILVGVISLLVQGLNFGIDFKGGTSWELPAPGVSVGQARDAVRPLGLGDATIQTISGNKIRVASGSQTPENQTKVTERLAELAHVDVSQVSVNDVGPSWGNTVTKKARNALIVFFILISLYISLRFEWKMALAALIAVVHDILVTVGVYSISRFEVTPATVVAFLTILGYSLYDTIVVFDKVQENTKGLSALGRLTYSDTVNLSMNQVLMRSINTSIVAIMPIVSILVIGAGILGATTLDDFGLALLVGLLTGAYSSIFVASPVLAMLKEREPRYVSARERITAKGGTGLLTPAAAAALAGGGVGARGANQTATLRPKAGAKAASAGRPVADAGDDEDAGVFVPAQPRAAGGVGTPRPRPVARPGAPKPRKKGKKR